MPRREKPSAGYTPLWGTLTVRRRKRIFMTKGLEIRAQIDTELVKGLLVMNGGGSVALLAFLPTLLGKPEFVLLTKAVLWGILAFQAGLVAAIVHNRLRRVCSLEFEKYNYNPPPCKVFPISLFKFKNDAPCVCKVSVMLMWGSIAAFLLAGAIVINGGFSVLDKELVKSKTEKTSIEKTPAKAPNKSLKQIGAKDAPPG